MKITAIKQKGDKMIISTDNKSRPTFAYPKDKFSSFNELEAEMERSLAASMKREEEKVLKALQLDKEIEEAMIKYEKEAKK